MNWKSYQPSASRAFRRLTRPRVLAGLLALGAALPVYAQSSSDPWDNAVNVLKTAKKTLAGIVFGVGMAIGAVNFMSWLFPS
jgi:hypothetical protein